MDDPFHQAVVIKETLACAHSAKVGSHEGETYSSLSSVAIQYSQSSYEPATVQ